jgi:hypothetical protein
VRQRTVALPGAHLAKAAAAEVLAFVSNTDAKTLASVLSVGKPATFTRTDSR